MPNVSQFLGPHSSTCVCYKCRVRREVSSFHSYLQTAAQEFGGHLPLLYNTQYDGITLLPNPPSEISLETVESIKARVKEMLRYNTTKRTSISAVVARKYAFCHVCGKYHKRNESHRVKQRNGIFYVCSTCVRNFYHVCADCGWLHGQFETLTVPDVGRFCATCFNRKYYRCSRCDRVHTLGSEHRVDTIVDGQSHTMKVCPACRTHLQTCTSCGQIFFESSSATRSRRGLCPQCYSEVSKINQYGYKPSPRFKLHNNKLRTDSLMTGFELELENKSDSLPFIDYKENEEIAAIISAAVGRGVLYYKRDGSLHSGFEIVSHPFSWEWYVENKHVFKAMIDAAYENGMRAMPSCGLHIHMSKKAFTTGHLYKFVKFMYSRANRNFIIKFSKRGKESSFATFNREDETGVIKYAKRKANCSHQRYSAVNATGNNTVEIRIFQGTDNFVVFSAALEFVYALYEYTKNCSMKQCTVPAFLEWMGKRENASQYRALATFLSSDTLEGSDKTKFKAALKKNHVSLNLTKKGK